MKMRDRLAVSTGLPVGLNGPLTVTLGPPWPPAAASAATDDAAHYRACAGVAGSRRARNESMQIAFALDEAAAGIRRDDRVKPGLQVSASLGVDDALHRR